MRNDPWVGAVLEGRYRIEERIAAGGMGVVYRAERVGLGRSVAVKFLHRSSAFVAATRERFHREAAAMSRLTHPNLVSIIDFGSAEDMPYLVMEYHAGASLRDHLARGRLSLERSLAIAQQMLAGLGSAHAAGVVHRDLKPGNVLLVEGYDTDFVKILDFGVAKLLDDGGGPSEISAMAGRVLGTPHYMAPEQVRVEAVDARTDLYAVGVMLYQMTTGRRPFEGDVDLVVLQMQLQDAPTPARTLEPLMSPDLEGVLARAMRKDPAERYQSAGEFAAALHAVPEAQVARSPSAPIPVPTVSATAVMATPRPPAAAAEPAWVAIAAAGRLAREASIDAAAPPAREAPRVPRRSRTRVWLLFVLLLATGAAGTWYAIEQRLVEVAWPAWLPWADDELERRPRPRPRPAPVARPAPEPPEALEEEISYATPFEAMSVAADGGAGADAGESIGDEDAGAEAELSPY